MMLCQKFWFQKPELMTNQQKIIKKPLYGFDRYFPVEGRKTIRKLRTEKLQDPQAACLLAIGFTGFPRWDDLKKIHSDDVVTTQTHAAKKKEKTRSKNDQYRGGSWTFIARAGEKQTSPVTLLERFLKIVKRKRHSRLFHIKVCSTKNGQRLRSASMT